MLLVLVLILLFVLTLTLALVLLCFCMSQSSSRVKTSESRLFWCQKWSFGATGHTWHSSTQVRSHTRAKTQTHTHLARNETAIHQSSARPNKSFHDVIYYLWTVGKIIKKWFLVHKWWHSLWSVMCYERVHILQYSLSLFRHQITDYSFFPCV